jgi:Arc/MetJ-type ribon-helix-helix transcriptional regulator
MKTLKTITISLPMEMGREMQTVAKEEHRTISELIRESFRKYQAHRNLYALAQEGRTVAKKKKITSKAFGGPFER